MFASCGILYLGKELRLFSGEIDGVHVIEEMRGAYIGELRARHIRCDFGRVEDRPFAVKVLMGDIVPLEFFDVLHPLDQPRGCRDIAGLDLLEPVEKPKPLGHATENWLPGRNLRRVGKHAADRNDRRPPRIAVV